MGESVESAKIQKYRKLHIIVKNTKGQTMLINADTGNVLPVRNGHFKHGKKLQNLNHVIKSNV